jgi:tetratricopeptide (TPR) repeat protein
MKSQLHKTTASSHRASGLRSGWHKFSLVVALWLGCAPLAGCQKLEAWLFTRHSPTVDQAVGALKTRDAGDATELLSQYLNTGRCRGGSLGVPDRVRERSNASFDLGLALFDLAERFGQKFGEEPPKTPEAEAAEAASLARRSQEIDCAQRLLRVLAADKNLALSQRAQAYYVSGNLEFLRHDYRAAVASYDSALELIPAGTFDAGQGAKENSGGGGHSVHENSVGENAAWNRAIALRRAEEQEEREKDKQPPDAGTPPPSDGGGGGSDTSEDGEKSQGTEPQDQNEDSQGSEPQDQNGDSQDQGDQEQDQPADQQPSSSGSSQQQQPPTPGSAEPATTSSAAPQQPSLSQDEQMLQMLERAPLLQQELSKPRGRGVRKSRLEDK